MIDEESLEIHRIVSNHVLNYIPIKPKSAANLRFPIGFMTNQCRLAAKDDKKTSSFSVRELRLAGKLLPWAESIDSKILENIDKNEIFYDDKLDTEYQIPLVVRALSGKGKTMLFSKLAAQMIYDHHNQNDEQKTEPKTKRILFSQLKDNLERVSLESALCLGLDKFHNHCRTVEALDTTVGEVDEKIIFIDSLDEHPAREQWWEISMKFSQYGWKVVWSCRNPDFDRHDLIKQIPKSCVNKYENEQNSPWNLLKGYSWDLELDEDRRKQLSEYLNDLSSDRNLSSKEQYTEFYQACYSKTQLMNIFYTNLSMVDEKREALDKLLLETIISNKDKAKKNNEKSVEDDLLDSNWYIQFFESLLTKLIIDSSLEFLGNEINSETHLNGSTIHSIWDSLCIDYYNLRTPIKNSELEETLPEIKDEDNERKILIQTLTTLGILREGSKFRHRDFAVVAYLHGCGLHHDSMKLKNNEAEDILFSFLNPIKKLSLNGTEQLEDGGIQIVNDFLRRTGNIIGFINPVKNLAINKDIQYIIARQSLAHKDDSDYSQLAVSNDDEATGLSEDQTKALGLSEGRRSIILKGFPGSGKTYAGVERIIFRQSKQHSRGITNSKSLIISLNDQLANSIRNELHSRHINSKYLKQEIKLAKDRQDILYKIEVKSLKNVIQEWLPEVSKLNENWHLGKQETYEIFTKLKTDESIVEEKDWRKLEEEFQNNMFDDTSGKLVSVDKFVNELAIEYETLQDKERWEKVRRLWHKRIAIRRKNGQISIIEASTVLRNQLLWYEHQKSALPNSQWNSDFHTSLNDEAIDEAALIAHFDKMFSDGRYDQVMVDEVQDLPAISVIALSFLSSNRKENRFVIAGDRDQTINGQQFDWELYLKRLSYISREVVAKHVNHIYVDSNNEPVSHHLKGLSWAHNEIEEVTDFHLTDNHRNHPRIVKYTKQSWKNWPKEGYAENDDQSRKYPLDKMESTWKRSSDEQKEITRIMEINTDDADNFNDTLEQLLRFLQTRARISLLIPNQWLRDYIKEEIMGEKLDTKLDSYNAWTIKGLERDAVVMICPYTASPKDSDSAILMNTALDDSVEAEEKKAIDLMRRKLLVSNTRAVEQMILLHPPKNTITNFGGKDQSIKCLVPPLVVGTKQVDKKRDIKEELERFFRYSGIDEKGLAIATLSEGIDLFTRAQSDVNQAQEIDYFMSRWNNISKADPNDSKLRRTLSDIINYSSETLEKCLIINHVLNEKFYSNSPIGEKERKLTSKKNDDYSTMLDNISSYEKSKPWSNESFDNFTQAYKNYRKIKRNIRQTRDDVGKREYRKGTIVDISKMFDKIESILKRQLRVVNIKLAVRDKGYETEELARLLFTNQLKLNQFTTEDIDSLSNIDYDFSKVLIDAFSDELRLTGKGFVATVSEGDLEQELWQNFISILVSLESKNKRDDYADFAIELCRLYYQKFSEISEKNSSSQGKINRNMQKPFLDILRVVNSIGDKETNKSIRDIIAFYFNNIHSEFSSDNDNNNDETYARLATEYLSQSLDLDVYILDKVKDESVSKWKLSDLSKFVEKLGKQTQKTAYKNRLNSLVFESRIFDKEIIKLIRNLVDKSMLSQEPKLITEDKLFTEIYEKLDSNPQSKDDIGILLGYGMTYLSENIRKNPQFVIENEASSKFLGDLMILDYILNDRGQDFSFLVNEEKVEEEEGDNERRKKQILYFYQNVFDGIKANQVVFANKFESVSYQLTDTLEAMKSRIKNQNVALSNQTNNIMSSEYSAILTKLRLINILSSKTLINIEKSKQYRELIVSNPALVQVSGKIFSDLSHYSNDNLEYIAALKEIYDNWTFHSMLNRIVERSHKTVDNFRVPYELGCSGLNLRFDYWVSNNDILHKSLNENRDDVIHLFDRFDLKSRIQKLLAVSQKLKQVIYKNRSKNQNVKTVIKNLITSSMDDDLFGVHSKLTKENDHYANSKRHDFYFCVYGRDGGELAYSSDRKGKISFERGISFKPTELYQLLDQIGCDIDGKQEKISREESIHNLEQSINKFTGILKVLDDNEQSQIEQNEIELSMMLKQVESKVESLENKLIPTKEEQQNNVAERAAEEKRIAEEKAAEEKRIAEERAAEDKEKHNQFDEESVYTHFKLSTKQWSSLSNEAKDGLIELFKNRKV